MSRDNLYQDILSFIYIEDVPEHGVSIQNLEVHNEKETSLIIGLNFDTGPALRAINMIAESGEWKIHNTEILDTYPPDINPGDTSQDSNSNDNNGCYIGGCSNQICSEKKDDVITTCEWLEKYMCYREATCERQSDGECGWTKTETLSKCLEETNSGPILNSQ